MVSASRYSAPASVQDGAVRLCYSLILSGRAQQVRISATQEPDGRALSDSELGRMIPKLHALDVAIAREIRSGTVFGELGDAQVARLLPLLAQRSATIDDQRLDIDDEEVLYPRVRVEQTPDCLSITLGLTEDPNNDDIAWYDIRKGRLLAGAQAYFLVGRTARPIDSNAAWELTAWAANPTRHLTGSLGPEERDILVARLAKAGVPERDLERLAVQRDAPDRIIVRLESDGGENPQVWATLEAQYGEHFVAIESHKPVSSYMMIEGGGGLIARDLAVEDTARRTLRSIKFRFDRERGIFQARGELALRALDPTNDLFPEHWIVIRGESTPKFFRDLTLSTEVRLREDRGLLDVSMQIGAVDTGEDAKTIEALIGMKSLLTWLQSNQSYLRLDDGSYVAPSQDFRRNLRIIEDLGAERKRVLVSPLCIGLLRLMGDHAAVHAADDATRAWMEEIAGERAPKSVEPPPTLKNIMRDYQFRGLDWLGMLHRHRLTGILADDMGLGKTLQTLALLWRVRFDEGPKPSLVIAPTSVVTVWRDEAKRFTPDLKVGVFTGSPQERKDMDLSQFDLVITSYGILRRDSERLSAMPFRYVVLDEAQAAKNASTQNAKAVRLLTSERRLALTGTPIENRAEELWAAFDFLAPGFLGNLRQFRKRYARPIAQNDADALAILRARVHPLILRRLKGDVAKELPDKIEQTVRCEFEPEQRALYDHIAGKLRDSVLEKIEKVGIERSHLDLLAALTRLRQICCDPALLPTPENGEEVPPSAKLILFEELMREALASNGRVVVFSQFVKMQKRLITTIKKLGIDPLWLHGGTRNRDKVVASFQDPNGPPVIVVSLKAGGTGLTLTRADTVMHYDPWWNPAVERQATDRTHRLGQDQVVSVYRLVCANTIEEKVLALAERKDQLAESLLSTAVGDGTKRITSNEVLALLS